MLTEKQPPGSDINFMFRPHVFLDEPFVTVEKNQRKLEIPTLSDDS